MYELRINSKDHYTRKSVKTEDALALAFIQAINACITDNSTEYSIAALDKNGDRLWSAQI